MAETKGKAAPPSAAALNQMLADSEDPKDKKARIRSIVIVRVAMFIFNLGFSIILTGVLPYMQQLLTNKSKDEILTLYGWVVSINPLGQMIFSPLLGAVSNKLGSIRLVALGTSVAYILGNILYSTLSIFPVESRFWLLIVSRFVVGAAAGNAASFISYVASATYQHERTREMSLNSAAMSLGFIVGPGIQAALTPLQCSEKTDQDTYLDLDMYTLAGWVSAVMGVVSLIMFLPVIFTEYNLFPAQGDEDNKNNNTSATVSAIRNIDDDSVSSISSMDKGGNNAVVKAPDAPAIVIPPPDYLTLFVLIACFWLFFINFVILETLGTPMCMDEYAWTEDETLLYMGIALSVGGAIAMCSFISIGPLSARFDERKVLIFAGIIPTILTRLLMFPVGGGVIIMANDTLPEDPTTTPAMSMLMNLNYRELLIRQANDHAMSFDYAVDPRTQSTRNVECGAGEGVSLGCSYDWCETQPQLNMVQFFIGFLAVLAAYPYTISITQSLYSKVLGPRPQGLWMGFLTGTGCFARVVGPIFVTYVYNASGLYLTFGLVELLMVISLVLVCLVYKRLVPLKVEGLEMEEVHFGGH